MNQTRYSERIGVRLSKFQADLLRQYCEDFNQPVSTTLRRSLLQVLLNDNELEFETYRNLNDSAEQSFSFRATPEEKEKLEKYADEVSENYSTVIRTAVDTWLWQAGY